MKQDLDVIIKLMEELKDEMQYGEEDFDERLGRKKPEIEIMKVEGEMPLKMDKEEDPKMGMDDEKEEEMEMEDEFDEEIGSFIPKNDPDEALKKRLMKLRG